MRPLFTIHAGEYVFGQEVLNKKLGLDLWIPAKDRGIDFLITNEDRSHSVAVQVKMSKDYRPIQSSTDFDKVSLARGWFTFSHHKLETSPADVWSLILVSSERQSKPVFINLSPDRLLKKLKAIHGHRINYNLYPCLLELPKGRICLEGRGLKKDDRRLLASNKLTLGSRDLTEFYENWNFLTSK